MQMGNEIFACKSTPSLVNFSYLRLKAGPDIGFIPWRRYNGDHKSEIHFWVNWEIWSLNLTIKRSTWIEAGKISKILCIARFKGLSYPRYLHLTSPLAFLPMQTTLGMDNAAPSKTSLLTS
jgi:hypothetical protein